jgi:hypothetical protein
MNSYKVEIQTEAENIKDKNREEGLRQVIEELGIEDEVELGSPIKRKNIDPVTVSLGVLVLQSVDTLIHILEYIEDSNGFDIGMAQTESNELVSLIDSDKVNKEVIVNNGGIVIGEVNGDLVVQEENADSIELTIALNEAVSESDKVDEQKGS